MNESAIIVDLSKIASLLNCDPAEKEKFLNNFGKWVDQRKNTIMELDKLKEELNKIDIEAKIAKLIGQVAGAAGTIATIAGLGLSYLGNPPVRIVGKYMTRWGLTAGAGGGAASVVGKIIENASTRKSIIDVKMTIEKDQQMTKELIPYLKHSEDLNDLFKKVFECDILSDTAEDIFCVIRGIMFLCKQGKYTFSKISDALSSSMRSKSFELNEIKRIFQSLSEKAQIVLKELCENSEVRATVLQIQKAIKRSVFFDVVKACLKITGLFGEDYVPYKVNLWQKELFLMDTLFCVLDAVNSINEALDLLNSEPKYSEKVEIIRKLLMLELGNATDLVYGSDQNQI